MNQSMPALHIEVAVGPNTTTFGFRRPLVRIGRSTENDLVLPDQSVWEFAATLALKKEQLFELKSPTGGTTTHENGASVAMGRYGLTFVAGEPLSEREEEFLRQLRDRPADDQTRLVYSDWLEENGKPAAAEFIRAQLELLTLDPADTAKFAAAKEILHTLARNFPAHWRRTVARPEIENCGVRFELQCPKQWAQLAATTDPNQRYCSTCDRNVHYAPNVEKARKLAIAGACVAVDIAQPRHEADLQPVRWVTAGMIAPPPRR